MNKYAIREVVLDDVDLLQVIARQTFIEAFAADNTKKAFNQYLDKSFSKEQLNLELNNPDSAFYFLEDNKDVIGYLKINEAKAQTEHKLENALEVERIYLLTKHRGEGVGKLLMDKAIDIAKGKNKKVVWLGVWEDNPSSIKFYQKYGFRIFDKHTFMLGDEAQKDFLMKLELDSLA